MALMADGKRSCHKSRKPPSPTENIWRRARSFIIIRNVIALLLLKDRGQGEKGSGSEI